MTFTPRFITTPDQLDALTHGAVVITPRGRAVQASETGRWRFAGDRRASRADHVLKLGPVLLVYPGDGDITVDVPGGDTTPAGDFTRASRQEA